MKAALIIDMPDNCIGCPISTCYSCHVHVPQPHPRTGKPDWCPLRELPEYMTGNPRKSYNKMYKAGYNACLDDILDN